MTDNGQFQEELLKFFVDYLLPELKPYEAVIYLYLLRHSHLAGSTTCRVGKRTLALDIGVGSRSEKTSYAHVSEVLIGLREKGCILIGDTTREGTLYTVLLPSQISLAKKRYAGGKQVEHVPNYFEDPSRRRELFERDEWICQYCGEVLSEGTATLDHYVPRSKGGTDSPDNLKTCCLMCNSVKSGKTFEEAAPELLLSVKKRRTNSKPDPFST